MDRWRHVAGVLSVGLLFVGSGTNAVDLANSGADADRVIDFDIPAQPLRSAVEAFSKLTDGDTYIGHEAFEACGTFTVKPLVGRMTARNAWARLTAPICAASGVVIGKRAGPIYMVDHPWVLESEVNIPKLPLSDALQMLSQQFGNLQIEYRFTNAAEKQTLVGPITGRLNAEEALRTITRQVGSGFNYRQSGFYEFLLASGASETDYKSAIRYGNECSCLAGRQELVSATVVVVKPALANSRANGVVSFTHEQIEATGASTLPEFFRFIAQNGHSRPAGYDASGAQYADFRGLGRDTHLVTINGRRTLPSANNIISSAFDLNTIPLPAVERVDFHVDSASMRYGADAIAGSIDIVTRREISGEVTLRYGAASGGAEERRTTLSFGHQGGSGRFSAVFDHFQLGDLLGRERALFRNQDYSRYDGEDYRTGFSIRSVDGSNLAGLETPLAGWPDRRSSDRVSLSELTPGRAQLVSLSSFQSLVPAGTRKSFVGAADYKWRGFETSADVLWVRRDSEFQYYPATASGLVGENYPGNPFAQSVWVDALLSGAPSMEQHVESELRRVVFGVSGSLRNWNLDLSVISSDETAEAWVEHVLKPGDTSDDPLVPKVNPALDVFARNPGGFGVPAGVWAERHIERFSSYGKHALFSVDRALGPAHLQFGIEHRSEAMQFSAAVGRIERDVVGRYAHIELPLIRPEKNVFGVNRLTALAGARYDSFSDADAVTRKHFELRWEVTGNFSLQGNISEQYRPATIFEMNVPAVSVPIEVYDTRRAEVATATLISGGNSLLRPTTGKSTNLQASFSWPSGLVASANYFAISQRDRISVLPLQALLAAEDLFPERVQRESTAEDLASGRPGRIRLVDTTRANVGRSFTSGVDLSLRQTFHVAENSLTPQIAVTRIDAFRYSDSLSANAPMIDRVGIASELGTITRWRAVASLQWERGFWGATTGLRLIPSYEDIDGRDIGSQKIWDLSVSYSPTPRVMFILGATDIANTSPHFAKVGAATGYDSSQWDPVGRRFMLTAKVSL